MNKIRLIILVYLDFFYLFLISVVLYKQNFTNSVKMPKLPTLFCDHLIIINIFFVLQIEKKKTRRIQWNEILSVSFYGTLDLNQCPTFEWTSRICVIIIWKLWLSQHLVFLELSSIFCFLSFSFFFFSLFHIILLNPFWWVRLFC